MLKPKRAQPMSRESRRAAIMDATIPLLIAHGQSTTSRQIAEAAGVAEGTIYAVFEDKQELIAASVNRHLNSTSLIDAIAEIEPGLELAAVVERIVTLTKARAADTFALLTLLRASANAGRQGVGRPSQPPGSRFAEAVGDLLRPYADQLDVPPRRAALAIRAAAFSMVHPLASGEAPLSAAEATDLLLYGLAASGSRKSAARTPRLPQPARTHPFA